MKPTTLIFTLLVTITSFSLGVVTPPNDHHDTNDYDSHHHHQGDQHGYTRSSGKLPHEEDFEEWRYEAAEATQEPAYYKTNEQQFGDLHNRLLALTHHLAAIQQQIGRIYDQLEEVKWEDETARSQEIGREQIDRIDTRLASTEKLLLQVANVLMSKDYSGHFEELRQAMLEHHSEMMGAVPEAVHHMLSTGGSRIGTLLMIVVVMQVGWAVAYVGYKKRKKYKVVKYL